MEMPLYLHFIFAFIATMGYSVFFNVPRKQLSYCGLTGGIGWVIYIFLNNHNLFNPVSANFFAAFVVTLVSEKLARLLKKPAILFIIPGIIPLVPGLGMYKTMLNFVQGDYNLAIATGTEAILISGAIALGLMVTTSIYTSMNRYKAKLLRRNKKDTKTN